MERPLYYRLEGHTPVPCEVLQMQCGVHVAETFLKGSRVSTVFLGIDHNFFGVGPPLLFETMVFNGVWGVGKYLDQEMLRASTWKDAEFMHRIMCTRVEIKNPGFVVRCFLTVKKHLTIAGNLVI